MRKKNQLASWLMIIFLSILALTYLFPLLYMVFRSFLAGEPGTNGGAWNFSLESYRLVIFGGGFLRYTINSIVVLLVVCLANIVFSLMVGYAFARYEFPFRDFLFGVVLVTLMIPKQTLMVPILDLMVKIGLHDSLLAIILPFCVDSFNVFLFRQYIHSLPKDLEDAARTDGASELAILLKVVAPLSRPAIAIVVVNTAIITWNAFLFPLILIDSAAKRTLPVGLAMFTQGPYSTDWGALMAGSTISSLPIVILFLIFQREIIEGITAGALRE